MLSLHNILLVSPQQPQPQPQPQLKEINFVSDNAEYVQGTWSELSGVEEKVCRDCGNRAKKECAYGRCRTCCKSRGYDCATHVKSTWVPAARRRDKKVAPAAASGSSSSGGKRPRTELVSGHRNLDSTVPHSCNAAANVSLGLRTNSSRQDASFKETLPGKVQAPAVFRRIRVTATANGEAEIAYEVTVNISGHVFKGFLYYYGVDEKGSIPCVSELRTQRCSGPRSGTRCSPIDHLRDQVAASDD